MRNVTFICRACLWLCVTAVFVGASLVVVSSGNAQPTAVEQDHLKCYQVVKDTLPPSTEIVNLFNEQFGPENDCALSTRPPFFCAPTIKDNDNDLRGPALQSDFLCYRVQCKERNRQNIFVDDQFGQRQITIKDARLLCTPTQKVIPPPPCGQAHAPQCGGFCDVPGTVCKPSALANLCVCQ